MKYITLFAFMFSLSASALDKTELQQRLSYMESEIKIGKKILRRNIPESAVMSQAPPANAFRGVLYGHDIAIYNNEIFANYTYGWRVIVRDGSDWLYLDEPKYDIVEVDTKQKAYDMALIMIGIINQTAYDVLRDPDDDSGPEAGVELMVWILSNKVSISEDELVIEQ